VSQARAQYQAKQYQAAIAIAERALRIDRRSPDVYLVLAQSYMQLANRQLALQFVQQGIRYAQAGTDLAQTLLQVRDSLQP
jgi:tetratricopeptide (TPR) repeat protein